MKTSSPPARAAAGTQRASCLPQPTPATQAGRGRGGAPTTAPTHPRSPLDGDRGADGGAAADPFPLTPVARSGALSELEQSQQVLEEKLSLLRAKLRDESGRPL